MFGVRTPAYWPMGLVLVVFGSVVFLGWTSSPRQDLAAEVQVLKTRIEKLEADHAAALIRQKTTDALLADVYTFFRQLPKIVEGLDSKMNDARTNGFEKAGPNPAAKTDVLDGIKMFCAALKNANPARKDEEK